MQRERKEKAAAASIFVMMTDGAAEANYQRRRLREKNKFASHVIYLLYHEERDRETL